MSTRPPRLVILPGSSGLTPEQTALLRRVFHLADQPQSDAPEPQSADLVLASRDELARVCDALMAEGFQSLTESAGISIGLVDQEGSATWSTPGLQQQPEVVRLQVSEHCRQAIGNWAAADVADRRQIDLPIALKEEGDPSGLLSLIPLTNAGGELDDEVKCVAVLWSAPPDRPRPLRGLQIELAGLDLLRIDAETITRLNSMERLKVLEEHIAAAVRDLLGFDCFEIRHLNPHSKQLDLVMTHGIQPLGIGEHMFADPDQQGISAYVAVTGKSHLCRDVSSDPRYRPGLEGAGSSLTIPLRLGEKIIGVFNAESVGLGKFDEEDRRLAESLCRYIAIALNMLDLLVVERSTTRSRVQDAIREELSPGIESLEQNLARLSKDPRLPKEAADELATIGEEAREIQERMREWRSAPRSLLGRDRSDQPDAVIPALVGKRILIADDDEAHRQAMQEALTETGCIVVGCADGASTIASLERVASGEASFDLVISDVSMPDCNGYEVYRATKHTSAETPVILMTGFGYDPHHSIVRSSLEGLQCFLFKPFRASQLIEEVLRALTTDGPEPPPSDRSPTD